MHHSVYERALSMAGLATLRALRKRWYARRFNEHRRFLEELARCLVFCHLRTTLGRVSELWVEYRAWKKKEGDDRCDVWLSRDGRFGIGLELKVLAPDSGSKGAMLRGGLVDDFLFLAATQKWPELYGGVAGYSLYLGPHRALEGSRSFGQLGDQRRGRARVYRVGALIPDRTERRWCGFKEWMKKKNQTPKRLVIRTVQHGGSEDFGLWLWRIRAG